MKQNAINYFKHIYCSAIVYLFVLIQLSELVFNGNRQMFAKSMVFSPVLGAILSFNFTLNLEDERLKKIFLTEGFLILIIGLLMLFKFYSKI